MEWWHWACGSWRTIMVLRAAQMVMRAGGIGGKEVD
jgi:hypothetical protein